MAKSTLMKCVALAVLGSGAAWAIRVATAQQDVVNEQRPVVVLSADDGTQAIADAPQGNRLDSSERRLLGEIAQAIAEAPQSEYWLGLQIAALPEVIKKQLAVEDGLVVEEVAEDSPAAKAEIKKFDILVKAGETPLKSLTDLVKAVDASQGKEIIITIVRNGKNQTIKVIADKRPEAERFTLQHTLQFPQPEFRAEIKRLEEALEGLKAKAGKDGVGFFFAKPGVVARSVELNDAEIAVKAMAEKAMAARTWKVELPKNLSVQINKEGDQPAKIRVKRGEKEWNVAEDKLAELPGDIQHYVEQMLGKTVAAYKAVRVTPGGRVEGDVLIAPMPPKPATAPKPPAGLQAASPVKPATTQANRTMTVRTHHKAEDADLKLDTIIKKLDERSESIEKLDKKVEELRKEIDQLRKK
jgi:membrane-associated protease RseP (regulator of RpoE activity)